MANVKKRMRQNLENMKAQQETVLELERKKTVKGYWSRYILMMLLYAAIYFCLTYFTGSLSYGIKQFRIAEAMTAIVFFDPAAFPGLCIGCFAADFFGPGGLGDAVMGTFATAFGIYAMKWWSQINGKPVIGLSLYAAYNAVMVSLELLYSGASTGGFLSIFMWLMLGEAVCAVLGGGILYFIASRRWKDLVSETKKSEKEGHVNTILR